MSNEELAKELEKILSDRERYELSLEDDEADLLRQAAAALRSKNIPKGYVLVDAGLFSSISSVLTVEQNREICRLEGERLLAAAPEPK